MTLINISIKGGPGSGNWGHRGIPGKVGGSSPRGAGMSPTSGKDWLQRYEKKTGREHPTAAAERERQAAAERKRLAKKKVRRTSYVKPDSYENYDAYELRNKSKKKIKRSALKHKGRVMVNTSGDAIINVDARPKQDKSGGQYEPEFVDLANYAGYDSATSTKFRLLTGNVMKINSHSAGLGKGFARSGGARKDAQAEYRIRDSLKALVNKGFPLDMMVEWMLDSGKMISRTIQDWVR